MPAPTEDIDYYKQYLQNPVLNSVTNILTQCEATSPKKLQALKKSLVEYALKCSNPQQRKGLTQRVITNARDFADILLSLNKQQKEMVYDTLKESLINWDNSSEDIVNILDNLPITQIDDALELLASQIKKYPDGSTDRTKINEKIKEFKGEGLSLFHRAINFLIKRPIVIRFTPQFLINRIFADKTIGSKKLHEVLRQLTAYSICTMLNYVSDDNQKAKIVENLQKNISNELTIRTVGHRLGLHGKEHEGLDAQFANSFARANFKQLTQKEVALDCITSPLTTDELLNRLKEHAAHQGIHAHWPGHGFSLHLIRENDKTHIIYVNRGQEHEKAGILNTPVMAYTFDNADADTEIQRLHQALKTKNRDTISNYINTIPKERINQTLTRTLAKSTQKTGNCSIANANIAWHFKLATDLMKENPAMSLMDAYTQTKEEYKQLRMTDRADALKTLLSLRHGYEKNNFNLALFETMEKMVNKDLVDPKRKTISFLLNSLKQTSPNELASLFELITHKDFLTTPVTEPMLYAQLKWAEAIGALLPRSPMQKNTLERLQKEPKAQIEKTIQTFESKNNKNLDKIIASTPQYINYLKPKTITRILLKKDNTPDVNKSFIDHLNENHLIDFAKALTELDVLLNSNNVTLFLTKKPHCLQYVDKKVIKSLATLRTLSPENKLIFETELNRRKPLEQSSKTGKNFTALG